jgi:ribosomal protein S26
MSPHASYIFSLRWAMVEEKYQIEQLQNSKKYCISNLLWTPIEKVTSQQWCVRLLVITTIRSETDGLDGTLDRICKYNQASQF